MLNSTNSLAFDGSGRSRHFSHARNEHEARLAANVPPHLLWERMDQAGFWVRLAAYILDGIVLNICLYAVVYAFVYTLLYEGVLHALQRVAAATGLSIVPTVLGVWVCSMLATFVLYDAVFHWSRLRATPGKLAFGIIVTTTTDGYPSFFRTLLRSILKLIGTVPFYFGFLFAVATSERLAMHDILTGTRVRETYQRSSLARWVIVLVVFVVPSVLAIIYRAHLYTFGQ